MIQTLSTETLTSRRAETINAQPLRKTVPVSSINLVDDQTIEWDGKRLNITETAFKNLIQMLGMNKKFTQKFESLFNAETKAKFINQMKNAMAAQLNEITMIVSPIQRKVVGFHESATDTISNERFLDLTDRLIDQHGFEVTNWGVAPDGSVTINAFNPNAQFEIGVKDEVFTAGLTMKNSPMSGIEVMPYVNRLWCTNGLTTSLSKDTYTLQDLTPQSMENFFQHMAELRRNGFVPTNLGNTIKKAINTPASLWELERGHKLIKPFVGERADNWIPLSENMDAYYGIGQNPKELSAKQKQRARSNQSVWSLVNSVTHVARHAPEMIAFNMTDADSTKLIIHAGEILGSSWNLSNEMPNPWNSNKLDPALQIGSILN
jgi:hypothetical protein